MKTIHTNTRSIWSIWLWGVPVPANPSIRIFVLGPSCASSMNDLDQSCTILSNFDDWEVRVARHQEQNHIFICLLAWSVRERLSNRYVHPRCLAWSVIGRATYGRDQRTNKGDLRFRVYSDECLSGDQMNYSHWVDWSKNRPGLELRWYNRSVRQASSVCLSVPFTQILLRSQGQLFRSKTRDSFSSPESAVASFLSLPQNKILSITVLSFWAVLVSINDSLELFTMSETSVLNLGPLLITRVSVGTRNMMGDERNVFWIRVLIVALAWCRWRPVKVECR